MGAAKKDNVADPGSPGGRLGGMLRRMEPAQAKPSQLEQIQETVRRFWGFDALRPLQEQAIRAGLDKRDSLVVMPTGGGKSLCYHVPPAVAQRTDIVVSPLIALMKDQVDGLRACGYPAAALHGGTTPEERREIETGLGEGRYRLVFVAPERLLSLVPRDGIGAFVIDEAHCISQWGHDFRPEYRRLATLKELFPGVSLHGFTATATPRVRADIVEQLRLNDPTVLVGRFDRANLVYRVVPRVDVQSQVADVIRRHAGEAVIVYCISRKDTERMAASLQGRGVRACAYHAGMDADKRRRTQDAFAAEQLDVVVATVAFGMGIDRSNVRCVIHAAMPKSVEHYQQETGRAGRDGLEAECVLFYSAADAMKWESLIRRSAEEAHHPADVIEAAQEKLAHMRRFCSAALCRHKSLSDYFEDTYDLDRCDACDVCLGEIDGVADATVTAQKILSCVARVDQRFGVRHVVEVLLGADTDMIRRWRHQELSTHGLMKGTPRNALTNMVYQLVDQGLLARSADEWPTLQLNEASLAVMRGEREVLLVRPKTEPVRKTDVEDASWEGVDRGLFEHLRGVRRELAEERSVPAYVIFGDKSLRDMARLRPGSDEAFCRVRGVGERKLADLGARFTAEITGYCKANALEIEPAEGRARSDDLPLAVSKKPSLSRQAAFKMFAQGRSVSDVASSINRAASTTRQYLVEYVQAEQPESIEAWVDPATYRAVARAADEVGTRRLRPIFECLSEAVPYDTIRLVARHLEVRT